ncbi:phage protein d [Bacillus sp. OxB-1]|uniref:phage late control D family protein n=1 Tax=Bacillus sp. (strain OxB-1) TaxID=98228 RepID=UPI000581DD71|nr:contractile injection system protein, VgrG/Pvc8 family [Bacillus sp. OxB-1]BAQ11441.1 phage protein d [Bacillus sp. OxB-1]
MTNARRTDLSVIYNNIKLTEELGDDLVDWTYTDNLSGEIDDLQLVVQDAMVKWLNDWFPSKGSLLNVEHLRKHWNKSVLKTKLGKFEVDELSGQSGGTRMTIKALSVPESTSIRGEHKSKAWEKATLKQVAGDIAKVNKLKLHWQSSDNPKKDRYEQESETDLAFLHRLCKDEGLCLKLSNKSIVILDEADYEAKPVVDTIYRRSKDTCKIQLLDWSFKTTLTGTYKDCRVQSHAASKKKTIKATFAPPKAPKVGRTLIVKDEVKSVAEAYKLAKKRLRDANKNATTVNLVVISEIHIDAGMTFTLSEFGRLNGKYIVTKVIHNKSKITLDLRKCLEGY